MRKPEIGFDPASKGGDDTAFTWRDGKAVFAMLSIGRTQKGNPLAIIDLLRVPPPMDINERVTLLAFTLQRAFGIVLNEKAVLERFEREAGHPPNASPPQLFGNSK